jgi:hypothetical protein
MEPIQLFLKNVKLEGEKQSHYNMALFPLLVPDVGEPDCLVLEEALGQGAVEITEVSHEGSVSDLKAINKSRNKLLVVDGEEVVGAKQNRIVKDTLPFGCKDLRLKCCIPMENLKQHFRKERCMEFGGRCVLGVLILSATITPLPIARPP